MDAPINLGLERSFVLTELKWFREQILPVLLAPLRPIPYTEKHEEEQTTLQQWQTAVRRLMRGVLRSDNKTYPLLNPEEFKSLYATLGAEFACLLKQPRRPLYTVEGWRIVWDIQLCPCSPYLDEVTKEMSLANNHFAAIGPQLKPPVVQADVWRNHILALSLFAVLFHKVQALRVLMRNRQNGERPA